MSRGLAAAGLVFVATQFIAVSAGLLPSGDGVLFDPDCYARLLRIRQLLETGGWYRSDLAALNAPYGLAMHWTRPLDLLILALALPLSVVLPLPSALFWAGAAISPLLGLAAIWVLHRQLAGVIGQNRFVLAMALLSVQRGVLQAFAWGRPDHHSLVLFLLAVILAGLATSPEARREEGGRADLLGGVSALGLWVSLESLLGVLVCLLCLGLAASRRGGVAGDVLARYCRALALGTVLALIVERPPGEWLLVEMDRLSVVHGTLTVLLAVATRALAALGGAPPVKRLAVAAALAVAIAGIMAIAYPGFFDGPYAHVGPVARRMVVDRVSEARPLWAGGAAGLFNALLELSLLPAALVMVIHRLRRGGAMPAGVAAVHAVGLAVFFAAAGHAMREAPALQLFCAIPAGDFAIAAGARAAAAWRQGRRMRASALGGAAGALMAGGFIAAMTIHATRWQGVHLVRPTACHYDSRLISQLREMPGNIMIFPMEEGPAAAWFLSRPAVGGPYHRNEDGIRDTLAFFGSMAPDQEALAGLRARSIGIVMLCRRSSVGGVDPRRLVARLARGDRPDWLSPLSLTQGTAGDISAFIVGMRE